MRMYRWASRRILLSYETRLLAAVFGSCVIALAGVALWLLANGRVASDELVNAAALGLAGVVVGVLLSRLYLYRMLAPLRRAADAMDRYHRDQTLCWLPVVGNDDMARLLRGINRCLHGIDAGRRELERHAVEDPLTHALNRRGCERALADSMTLARNGRTPFVLLVVDLDNLKQINDEHGHAAGDLAIHSLVELARASLLGEHDWIGRWGGDEFLIGLHDRLEPATARTNAWLEMLETRDGSRVPVHVSAGCAHYEAGVDMDGLYRLADSRMYEAKFSGGHRLVGGSVRSEDRAAPRPGARLHPVPAGAAPALADPVRMAGGR
ncbi:GGDEF domain-containing protein [Luteimonas vadosa]